VLSVVSAGAIVLVLTEYKGSGSALN
jgi:hypothetical protein